MNYRENLTCSEITKEQANKNAELVREKLKMLGVADYTETYYDKSLTPEELVNLNYNLVLNKVKNYMNTYSYRNGSNSHKYDEMASAGLWGLYKAAKSYDPNKKVKFATYASRCIENEINYFLRGEKKHSNNRYLDEIIDSDNDGKELTLGEVLGSDDYTVEELVELQDDLEELLECLPELGDQDLYVLTYRYGLFGKDIKQQNEIAEDIGKSQPYISRIDKRAVKELRSILDSKRRLKAITLSYKAKRAK